MKHIRESGFEIIHCDTGKMVKPTLRGWRAIHLDLRAPNGQLLEFQIVPEEMNTVGKAGHHAGYSEWRNKNPSEMSAHERIAHVKETQTARKEGNRAWKDHLSRTELTQAELKKILNDVHEEAEI